MKKDKKWLKAEIDNQAIIMDKGYIHRGDLMYLIDKLDEPEVLSQEWIDKHAEYYEYLGYAVVPTDKLQNLLVPKQELPVVPKYVDEWIIKHRDAYNLYQALRKLENNTLFWGPIYEWYRIYTHKFVNAYLTGEYEVEEDPMYYALIKGHELVTDKDDWTFKYWKTDTSNGRVFPSHRLINHSDFLTEMTKEDWNELGINDSNADFVKVEE